MKKQLCILLVLLVQFCAFAKPKAKEPTPMPVEITEKGGKVRIVQLICQDAFMSKKVKTQMTFTSPTGAVEFPIDDLMLISEVHDQSKKDPKGSALFTFNDGTKKRMEFGFCQEGVVVQTGDESFEKIDLRKIRQLRVLGRY